MSRITTAYNALIAKLDVSFASKTRIHNPYSLGDNPDITRKDAWGIKIEDASPDIFEFCNLTLSRTFTVIFIKNLVTLSKKEDGFDAVSVSIMEDQQTTANFLYSPSELGVPDDIDKIEITSISGIQEMISDEKRYLFGEVTFTITLSEQII